jgi:aspartate aminotransferase
MRTTAADLRFPADLARLLIAQERFDALRHRTQLRARMALVDLAYANAYDGPVAGVVEQLGEALSNASALDLQYTPYGGATIPRRCVAERLRQSHGLPFQYSDVILTSGAMAALSIVFRSLRTAGDDEAIVVAPCWIDYPLYLAQVGIRAVMVPSVPGSLRLDIEAVRKAISPRTRAVIISQPANPSGVVCSRAELEELARVLRENNRVKPPLLISDECHRDFNFGAMPIASPLETYERACVVFSFGKSLFMQGQRIGYVAVSPEMPGRRLYASTLVRWSRALGFCTPSALMQRALPGLMTLRPDLSRIEARRARLLNGLRQSGFEFPASEATVFLYPRTPGGDDFTFVEQLATRGMLVLPAPLFHHRGHFRMSVMASDAMVDGALSILGDVKKPIGEPEHLKAAS